MTQEIERLEQKLKKLEKVQEAMKNVNSIVRKKDLSENEKIAKVANLGFNEKQAIELVTTIGWNGKAGFEAYQLTNNGANARATRERIERLKTAENTETKEYRGIDCDIEINQQENRIRLSFDGKPSEDVRALLKSNAFKWSPSMGVWQSYINCNSKHFVRVHFEVK